MLFHSLSHELVNYLVIFEEMFVTNFWYGHCTHIYFSTVNLLYGIIFNRCTLLNLFNFAKNITCLSIVAEWYFWHYVVKIACSVFMPISLYYIYLCWKIDLTNFERPHHLTSWSNPVFYTYICNIYLSLKNMYWWLFWF